MKRALAAGIVATIGLAPLLLSHSAGAGNGTALNTGSANVLTIAVQGDVPYGSSPSDTAQFDAMPAYIDSINADPAVDLVVHIGDIHSGKQYCTRAYDESISALWARYKDPLIYTPGDNEWSDCHKVAEGGGAYNKTSGQIAYVLDAQGNPVDYAKGDPVANLDLVRSTFFSDPGVTLGGRKKHVLTQAQVSDPAHASDAKYVENVMWEQSKVLFVTINLPGGSNNDNDVWYGAPSQSAAQAQEVAERTGADLRWLDAAFAQASADGMDAVLIGAQADMWDPEKGVAHQSQYEPFVQRVAALTQSFAKPVLMINGDSHVYRSDNPLAASDPLQFMHPGYDVTNFHRIVVHGSTMPLEWLRLTVDPRASAPADSTTFGPFHWERMVQP